MRRTLVVASTALWFATVCRAQPSAYTVFAVPLSGITAAQASAPLPTRRLAPMMHLIQVEFPSAAGSVSPIQVRLEASFDGSTWLPVSPDITSAPLLSGRVFAFEKAYGVFPALRINSVINVPGGVGTMTVRYTGMALPVAPFLTQLSDRWAF
jgi:hypothetical protein